ncbi:hypothetical protein COOONC_19858, partial [Cooperia oncophora]
MGVCDSLEREFPGLSVLVHHLRTVHSKFPYECRCRVAFNSIDDALNHATTSSKCSSEDLVLNVTPIYNTRFHAVSTSSSDSMSPMSRSECSPDSGVQIDMDELEAERMSYVPQKTVNNNQENDSVLGLLAPTPLLSPSSKATLLTPLDLSTALLSLQLPFATDYFTTMVGFQQVLL